MEKYFYLLVGIIWLISNAYKSFQKKEANKPVDHRKNDLPKEPVNIPEKKEKGIETILEEILVGEQIPSPKILKKKEKSELKPSSSQEALVEEATTEVIKSNTFSYENAIESRALQSNIAETPMAVEQPVEENSFDLKNAFIYSEILSKPKWFSDKE